MTHAIEPDRLEPTLTSDQKSWDLFNEILDGPAKPVSGLADLLKRPSMFSD